MTDEWKLFDRLAGTYDEVIPFFATFAASMLDLLDPEPGTRLLDVGAGRGAIAGAAASRGCAVTAIDAAPRMIELLRIAYPDVDARVMDAHHLDLPGSFYDLATAGFVIHVVADAQRVLAEMKRTLRPGGRVAFTTPDSCDDGGRWDAFQALVARFRPKAVRGGRPGKDVDLPEILAAAGFADIRETSIEVHIPIDDPQTAWRFHMSHGFAGFVHSLSPDDAAQFQELALGEFTRMHSAGGILLDRGATLTLATAP